MGVAVTSRYKMNINGTPLQLSDFTFVENLGEVTGYATAQLIPPDHDPGHRHRRRPHGNPSPEGDVAPQPPRRPAGQRRGGGSAAGRPLPRRPLQKAALALDQDSADQSARNQQAGGGAGHLHRLGPAGGGHQAEGNAQAAQLADTFRKGALAPGAAASEGTPDIIFITSESFFDVTRLPGITFEEDPLPNFHRLAEASTNGWCLSNNYGNGTGNVEMEMFTGLSSSPPPGGGHPSPPWTRGFMPSCPPPSGS